MKSTSSKDYQDVPRPVGAMAKEYSDGYVRCMHRHARAQLLYAVTGVMEVTTADGLWVVPPQRAVWLPPATDHAVRARGPVALRTLYVRPAVPRRLRCLVPPVAPAAPHPGRPAAARVRRGCH